LKNIICVCTGGFGNRIRPLSSCAKIAKMTGRALKVWWVNDHRCGMDFNELFENKFDFVDESFIDSIRDSGKCYIHSIDSIRLSARIIGIPLLSDSCERFPYTHVNTIRRFINNDKEKNVFVFSDNFMRYEEQDRDFIWNLSPVIKIQNKIDEYAENLGLDKSVVGVHARGSDFAPLATIGCQYYLSLIDKKLKENPDSVLYVASDDIEYEKTIRDYFPDTKILIRDGKFYVKKKDPKKSYKHNALIDRDAMIDGIIEMYLLSMTSLIGHPQSTFFQLARIISQKEK
jgi:hypothetical protein